jgi:photosystem II stability/assembly factor-like uncharacterized protein
MSTPQRRMAFSSWRRNEKRVVSREQGVVKREESEVADQNELDGLYREAQAALKAKEYDRAVGLLTQILVIDENYKDVSRLLAKMVKLKRRKWYSHPALWGTLGAVLLLGLGYFFIPKVSSFYAAQTPTQMITATTTPSPIPSATATATLLPTPTPIPLTWKRISMGQEFQRDVVTAFATDKKDPDVIYAAMMNAGVYKTIDGGLSWFPAHHGLASAQVESLLIDSQGPRILYAIAMGGIFRTEDGGESWFRIGNGAYLLMDYQNNSHLYARDENGIYETTDQGNNWTTVYTLKQDCPDAISSWAIHPADGNMLFLGGGETCAGVYQSNDSGRHWTLIGLKDKPNLNPLTIGLDEQGNYSIYTSFESPIIKTGHGVYVSHDGGANWSFTSGGCGINSAPNDPSTIYCVGLRLLVKRGKGSWQNIPDTGSKEYSAVHIDYPNGTERIITSATYVSAANPYVGIFISTDGGASWVERNIGIGSVRSELKIDPMNSTRIYLAAYYMRYYVGGWSNCALYNSQDSGKNWLAIKGKADWCGPTFDVANVLYLIEAGALQMSSNGGENWLWDSDEEWGNHLLPSYFLRDPESISANPYTKGLVYDIGDPFYYSTGSGWQKSSGSEGLRDARLFYTDQSKMIFAIGRYHQKYSTDNGKTWQNCGQEVTASRSDTRLALTLDGLRLYLATPGQGVLISTDSCGSWQASNEGLSNLFVNTLAIDPNDTNKICAGTDGGAYISYDSGATWGQVNDGLLGATVVYSIAVDKESNVYAATPYGVFKLESK